MRIGDDDCFLRIDRRDPTNPYSYWRVEARATYGDESFSARHECVMLDDSEQTKACLREFWELKTNHFELPFSGGGWLRAARDSKGYLSLRYRLAGGKAAAALEGELHVPGEFANAFCRELAGVLMNKD